MTGKEIRRIVIEQSYRSHHGHIGCSLSIAEIVCAIYGTLLRASGPKDSLRDYFVLSKGHAALALYASLFLKGWLTRNQLNSYCDENSLLGVHPEHELSGVEWSTGSLGQGLPVASGLALASHLKNNDRKVYALLSDAECNEGSVWEAAMFAGHHKLSNLTVIVDWNGQQALGKTSTILNQLNLVERWAAFGWDAVEVDGHDLAALCSSAAKIGTKPKVLLAKTIFGKGVSFMENQIKWHYLPLSELDYHAAMEELGGGV